MQLCMLDSATQSKTQMRMSNQCVLAHWVTANEYHCANLLYMAPQGDAQYSLWVWAWVWVWASAAQQVTPIATRQDAFFCSMATKPTRTCSPQGLLSRNKAGKELLAWQQRTLTAASKTGTSACANRGRCSWPKNKLDANSCNAAMKFHAS